MIQEGVCKQWDENKMVEGELFSNAGSKTEQVGLVLFRQSPDPELDSRRTLEPNKDPSNPAELANPAALM